MSNKIEILDWLEEKLADAETSLRARKQMEAIWEGGTDESWREVGCQKNKSERLKESKMQGRIAAKCRRDVEMLRATIVQIENL